MIETGKRFDARYENDPTPSRTVVERYREVVRHDDADASLALVHYRGTRLEFEIGVEYALSDDPDDRAVGADVLGQLGWYDGEFLDDSVELLIRMLGDPDSHVVYSAACALGHRADPRAIPHLIELASHPDSLVRYGVVHGLSGHEDPDAIRTLIRLSADADDDIRNWAFFGLGSQIDSDTPEIRQALVAGLSEPDLEIRGEALVGLARRKDAHAIDAIFEEWSGGSISLLSIEAAEELVDERLLPSLMGFLGSMDLAAESYIRQKLLDAIEACQGRETPSPGTDIC